MTPYRASSSQLGLDDAQEGMILDLTGAVDWHEI